MEKQLLNIREFCEVTGIGETMAKRLIREHAIVSVKVGDRRLVPAESVKAFVDRLIEDATPAAA